MEKEKIKSKITRGGGNARNSSVELLRIVSMLFIVISHASFHGGFPKDGSSFQINDLFLDWFTLGNLGVDIFVMITGYYMCEKELKIQRILKLLSQVWFYSLLSLLFGIVIKYKFTIKTVISFLFPTIFSTWWFFTAYFVIMILSPFINTFIDSIDRNKHKICISVMLTMWVVIPTFTNQKMFESEIPQFLMFYLIGAFLKKHPDNIFKNKKIRMCVTIISFGLLFMSSVVFRTLEDYFSFFGGKSILFYYRHSLLIVGASVGLFTMAIYRQPFFSSLINKIASCTFGVYLIHESPIVRSWLWLDIFHNYEYYNSGTLVVRLLLCAAIVFAVCSLIEIIRQKLFGKITLNIIAYIYEKILTLSKQIIKKIDGVLICKSS